MFPPITVLTIRGLGPTGAFRISPPTLIRSEVINLPLLVQPYISLNENSRNIRCCDTKAAPLEVRAALHVYVLLESHERIKVVDGDAAKARIVFEGVLNTSQCRK